MTTHPPPSGPCLQAGGRGGSGHCGWPPSNTQARAAAWVEPGLRPGTGAAGPGQAGGAPPACQTRPGRQACPPLGRARTHACTSARARALRLVRHEHCSLLRPWQRGAQPRSQLLIARHDALPAWYRVNKIPMCCEAKDRFTAHAGCGGVRGAAVGAARIACARGFSCVHVERARGRGSVQQRGSAQLRMWVTTNAAPL